MSTATLFPFSPSRLEAFRCPHRWKRIYVEGVREPDTEPMIVGKAVHQVLEAVVRDVLDARAAGHSVGFPGPRTKAVKSFVDKAILGAAQAAAEAKVEITKSAFAEIGRMARSAVAILGEIDPDTVQSEYHFEVPLPHRADGLLQGFVDLLVVEGNRGRIIDVKTSRVPYEIRNDPKRQLTQYAWALSQLFPDVEEWTLELHFVRHGELTSTAVYTKELEEEALTYLRQRTDEAFGAMEADDFPAVPGAHCGYCPIAANCPAALGEAPGLSDVATNKEKAEEIFGQYLATEARLRALREALVEAVEAHGPLHAGGEYLGNYTTETLTWPDMAAVRTALQELGLNPEDYFRLDETKLRRLADKHLGLLTLAETRRIRRFEHRSTPPESGE